VAFRSIRPIVPQQVMGLPQPVPELHRSQQRQTRRCEFERERKSVEHVHHLEHGLVIGVTDDQVRCASASHTLDERNSRLVVERIEPDHSSAETRSGTCEVTSKRRSGSASTR
jgi:hypothetical protein